MKMKPLLFLLPVLALAAACGGGVDARQTSGSTGSGGASSSATAGSSGGGAAPGSCGGKAGVTCGPDAFCQFDPAASCGNADATGTCAPRPTGCLEDCPGTCGCDGKLYCNGCDANAAGVDVSAETACMAPDTYEAVSLVTDAPRFAILEASPKRGLCFRVVVVEGTSPGLMGLTGDGLTVESAVVTDHAADCQVSAAPPPPPTGDTATVVSGSGTVSLAMSSTGCVAGIQAKVVLSGQPAWAPPSELMSADGLAILGGCP